MILKISFSNIFSFKDEQEISFYPQPLKELRENQSILNEYSANDIFLKQLAIYGHNSHGKTNVIKGIVFFINFIKTSFTQQGKGIGLENFMLNTSSINSPSKFEFVFVIRNIRYRYGFILTNDKIYEEWLYYAPYATKENYLFYRVDKEFRISRLWNKESNNKINTIGLALTTEKVLLLSVLIAQGNETATKIAEVINSITIIKDWHENELMKGAVAIFSDPKYAIPINKLIKDADLGFISIFDKIEKSLSNSSRYDKGFLHNIIYEKHIERFELYTNHTVYEENKNEKRVIEFDFLKNESAGSIKFFNLTCLVVYAIQNNQFLIIDELDSKLHSDLVQLMINYFNNLQFQSSTAQLVFTTHNTILLDEDLRRDQILLVEKNTYGESIIRPLHTKDRPVRSDVSIEKNYRKGKLGGVSKKIRENPQQGKLNFD